jgi:hypothetical protein
VALVGGIRLQTTAAATVAVYAVRDVTPLQASSNPPTVAVVPVGWVRPPLGGTLATRSVADPADPVVGVKVNIAPVGVALPYPAPTAVQAVVRDVTPLQPSAQPDPPVIVAVQSWLARAVAAVTARSSAPADDEAPPRPVLAPQAGVQPSAARTLLVAAPVEDTASAPPEILVPATRTAAAPAPTARVTTPTVEQGPLPGGSVRTPASPPSTSPAAAPLTARSRTPAPDPAPRPSLVPRVLALAYGAARSVLAAAAGIAIPTYAELWPGTTSAATLAAGASDAAVTSVYPGAAATVAADDTPAPTATAYPGDAPTLTGG